MRATNKQSEIQMVKGMRTRASSNNCLHWCWWGETFASLNKILPVHHGCNPNDQENSPTLKIRTAFSKNRKMYFHLEIKLTVNSSWFRVAMWAKHKQSEIQMVRRNSTSASSNNCLHWWEICFLNFFFFVKYCQYTTTAIQMIKRIRISSKFEQLPWKIGRWTCVSK